MCHACVYSVSHTRNLARPFGWRHASSHRSTCAAGKRTPQVYWANLGCMVLVLIMSYKLNDILVQSVEICRQVRCAVLPGAMLRRR
jgi:hypothetical protein